MKWHKRKQEELSSFQYMFIIAKELDDSTRVYHLAKFLRSDYDKYSVAFGHEVYFPGRSWQIEYNRPAIGVDFCYEARDEFCLQCVEEAIKLKIVEQRKSLKDCWEVKKKYK